jgi:hypothetical protein
MTLQNSLDPTRAHQPDTANYSAAAMQQQQQQQHYASDAQQYMHHNSLYMPPQTDSEHIPYQQVGSTQHYSDDVSMQQSQQWQHQQQQQQAQQYANSLQAQQQQQQWQPSVSHEREHVASHHIPYIPVASRAQDRSSSESSSQHHAHGQWRGDKYEYQQQQQPQQQQQQPQQQQQQQQQLQQQQAQPTTIRAKHILIKHMDSRNPKSHRDKTGAVIKQRTRDDAAVILQQVSLYELVHIMLPQLYTMIP